MGVFVFAVLFIAASTLQARELVNSIKARVNSSIILYSDLQQAQISKDGAFATLDELIDEELLVQRANERNMLPSDAEVTAQLISLKRDNGLTGKSDVECDAFLRNAIGINFATYKKQLYRFLAVRNVKTYDLGQRCIVTSDEIKEYFDTHPTYTPSMYRFKMATAPSEQVSVSREFTGDYDKLSWDNFGWMKQHEIARHLHAVMSLRPGEYSKPLFHAGEHIIVSLIDKAPSELIPLEKRYAQINLSLQEEKQERAADEFAKELRASAVVAVL